MDFLNTLLSIFPALFSVIDFQSESSIFFKVTDVAYCK